MKKTIAALLASITLFSAYSSSAAINAFADLTDEEFASIDYKSSKSMGHLAYGAQITSPAKYDESLYGHRFYGLHFF